MTKTSWNRSSPVWQSSPSTPTRKRMTTVHPKPGGGYRIMVKGAADVLLSRSTHILRQGVQPLDAGRPHPSGGRQRPDGQPGAAGAGAGV